MPSEAINMDWDWDDYQKWCVEGVLPSTHVPGHPLVYPALGLTGEAGEYADKVKKTIRDGMKPDTYEDMALELGDILWYLAVSAEYLGYDLSTIVEMNMAKLNRRREENKIQGQGDHR